MEIIEDMIEQKTSWSYGEISDAIFGKTSDSYQRFYQNSVVSALFYRMRHTYFLHVYQIGERVLVLRTKEQFNEVITDHEKRIEGLRKVITQLEKDKADITSGKYEKAIKERFDDFKSNRRGGDK